MEEILRLLPGPHSEIKRGGFPQSTSFESMSSALGRYAYAFPTFYIQDLGIDKNPASKRLEEDSCISPYALASVNCVVKEKVVQFLQYSMQDRLIFGCCFFNVIQLHHVFRVADGRRSLVLIVFIGGVTFAEIAALRFLSAQEGMAYELMSATTNMISGNSLTESYVEKLG
ncbi:Vacuolar protein-sorting-associated protein 33 homolog [Linum perenne]